MASKSYEKAHPPAPPRLPYTPIHGAADENGASTASFYDEFNGTNHDEDAREKSYVAADGWHQSQDAGVTAQVEVLHALGYDPIVPQASADKRPRPARNSTNGRHRTVR